MGKQTQTREVLDFGQLHLLQISPIKYFAECIEEETESGETANMDKIMILAMQIKEKLEEMTSILDRWSSEN